MFLKPSWGNQQKRKDKKNQQIHAQKEVSITAKQNKMFTQTCIQSRTRRFIEHTHHLYISLLTMFLKKLHKLLYDSFVTKQIENNCSHFKSLGRLLGLRSFLNGDPKKGQPKSLILIFSFGEFSVVVQSYMGEFGQACRFQGVLGLVARTTTPQTDTPPMLHRTCWVPTGDHGTSN